MKAAYTVPQANLKPLKTRIEKLNKRARRIGVPEISISHCHSHTEEQYENEHGSLRWGTQCPEGCKPTGRVRHWSTVTVDGKPPSYDGWELLGVLEPIETTQDGTENIVQTVPGCSIPKKYRHRVGECDHCQMRRRRNQTFVVRKGRQTRVVGRQCLKDFLGHADPHQLASEAELLCELQGLCTGAESPEWGAGFESPEWGAGFHEPDVWSLEHVLKVTSAVIRKEGWLSKSKAQQQEEETYRPTMATADYVSFFLTPPNPEFQTYENRQWLREIREHVDSQHAQEQADAAIEWARTCVRDGNDDYRLNLNLLTRAGYVKLKHIGLAASMIVAYRRDQDLDVEGKRKAKPESQHVGEVKQRREFSVACDRIFERESQWGVTGIHKLTDEHGNDLVWFASATANWLYEGRKYVIKGTVKEHVEFRGRKQTVVSRVKVVRELAEEQNPA